MSLRSIRLLCGLCRYAPYALRLGLCAPRIRPRYPQCFISSSRAPSKFIINVIGFVACREINAFPREFFPPVVIGVATIHVMLPGWSSRLLATLISCSLPVVASMKSGRYALSLKPNCVILRHGLELLAKGDCRRFTFGRKSVPNQQ